jgi:hypothetical protein
LSDQADQDVALQSAYVAVAEKLAERICVAEDALRQVVNKPANPLNWVGCEVATMQIRLVCELLLLGSTVAHLKEGQQTLSEKKWRPKDAFFQLDKISEHPLPIPIKVELNKNGEGQHHVDPISKPVPFDALAEIYGRCGDLLHVPTAKQAFDGKLPEFDVELLTRWIEGFKKLVCAHVLMLPKREIDLDKYPEFGLLP